MRIWVYKCLWVGCGGFWYLPTVVTLQNKSCVQKLSKIIRSLQYHFNVTSIPLQSNLRSIWQWYAPPSPNRLYPHSTKTDCEVYKSICTIICILIRLFVLHFLYLYSDQFFHFVLFKSKKSDFRWIYGLTRGPNTPKINDLI